jgi:hypothetical protein
MPVLAVFAAATKAVFVIAALGMSSPSLPSRVMTPTAAGIVTA